MVFPPIEVQLRLIRRGVAEIISEQELVQKLRRAEDTGRPLVVKLGCDPSRPDLHLGHSVVLRKLRQFQDLGHEAVLVIGDFTGMIGDPTGRSKTRPALSLEETRRNGQTYFEQASKILDPERTRIVYNSAWLASMTFADVIRLASKYTVARMLERDDFQKRYRTGEAIGIHEFLYPLAQAQDSVFLKADVELGGTDQKFNLLVGRDIQRESGQEPQVCVLLPILEGTDGVEKMSKSLGNYIALNEAPEQMYGKVLSIPDHLIYRYFELATDVPEEELPQLAAWAQRTPRDAKHHLAWTIVRMYHGPEAADRARAHFERLFVRREIPEEVPEWRAPEAQMPLAQLLRQSGLSTSTSEARRLIEQGGVRVEGQPVTDPGAVLEVRQPVLIRVGKRRFVRVLPPLEHS
ncbi:MAG: tyrosine--tRNA ligase [Bacteroidetes bacterium]|nr:tyrosine--tRNA ligase [Rhodothermia bacterium]MCS7155845.1 tyrosine--tRNA ligase [Bacteroidota bacterium]MCX7906054.1 tyrosine--tRNA ligase [Bacteroidota bacterium]MDW8138182.1 tyrosine--tRNA ligase [Bacteroidota bacterium]MDW8285866.1 tyrosine--tRNA ligase [Bacteroidota bacterium]